MKIIIFAIGLAWLCVFCFVCFLILLPWRRRRESESTADIIAASHLPAMVRKQAD